MRVAEIEGRDRWKGMPEIKDQPAATPPMGWNSWDCYGASVTEREVLGNAEYMASHLQKYGWEYVVVDIQWYEPEAKSSAYNHFYPLAMDEYGRLIPAVNRFPSSAGNRGFAPLAEKIHAMGLKFGIHILRGIPRQAVHANLPVFGADVSAREIAHPNANCPWNTDMYGVDASKAGAQAYYDSLFILYASWGVDYVKVDDISATTVNPAHYHAREIEMIRRAIDRCGRPIVLSLSPGAAPLGQAEHLKNHANLWRITDDYWDIWELLYQEFDRCSEWSVHSGPGHWPDADMLPLGHLSIRGCEHGVGERWTRFTRDEQLTMMTLWCIFRSPLMFGGELRDNDEWTDALLTNEEVLAMHRQSSNGRELYRADPVIVWAAQDSGRQYVGRQYVAVFNVGNREITTEIFLDRLGAADGCRLRDLWARAELGGVSGSFRAAVPPHGARLFSLAPGR
jgi:hypothetical protein